MDTESNSFVWVLNFNKKFNKNRLSKPNSLTSEQCFRVNAEHNLHSREDYTLMTQILGVDLVEQREQLS